MVVMTLKLALNDLFYVGNVQQMLLRALRKRVQPRGEIPTKKHCTRVDINRCQMCKQRFEVGKEDKCVGCDSCPRWYHKQCVGHPNVRKCSKC